MYCHCFWKILIHKDAIPWFLRKFIPVPLFNRRLRNRCLIFKVANIGCARKAVNDRRGTWEVSPPGSDSCCGKRETRKEGREPSNEESWI